MDVSVYSWFSPIFVGDIYLNNLLLFALLGSAAAVFLAGALAYAFPDLALWRNQYGLAGMALALWLLAGTVYAMAAALIPTLAKSRREKRTGRFLGVWSLGFVVFGLLWMIVPVSAQYVSLNGLDIYIRQQERSIAAGDHVIFYGVAQKAFDPATVTYAAYPSFDGGKGASLWSVTGAVALTAWNMANPDKTLDYAATVSSGDRLVRLDVPVPGRDHNWPVAYCLYDADLALKSVRSFLAPVDPANDPLALQALCPDVDTVRALPMTENVNRLFPFQDKT